MPLPVMKKMARFRNRLVHLYWEIDNETVYNILQGDLDDIDHFVSCICVFISEEKEDTEP